MTVRTASASVRAPSSRSASVVQPARLDSPRYADCTRSTTAVTSDKVASRNETAAGAGAGIALVCPTVAAVPACGEGEGRRRGALCFRPATCRLAKCRHAQCRRRPQFRRAQSRQGPVLSAASVRREQRYREFRDAGRAGVGSGRRQQYCGQIAQQAQAAPPSRQHFPQSAGIPPNTANATLSGAAIMRASVFCARVKSGNCGVSNRRTYCSVFGESRTPNNKVELRRRTAYRISSARRP